MNRITRRLFAAGAVAALVFNMAACGSDGEGSSGDKVTIGFIAPLKGANTESAKMMVNAAKLAVDEANANGGIDGRDVELKVYDDELSPDVAARVATRAINVDEVAALVGGLSSAEGLAIREVAERNEVPYLASASSATGVTEGAKFTFRVAATAVDQANAVVDIAKTLGTKKAAILFDNGAVGPALSAIFEARAKEVGVSIAGEPVEYGLASTDMSGPVQTVADSSPDVILIGGSTGADHGLIAKTMVEQGLEVPIIGLAGIGFPDAFEVGGDAYDKLPGAYFPSSVDTSSTSFGKFQAAYEKAYEPKSQYPDAAVQSYDAVRVAINGLIASEGKGGQDLADAITGLEPLVGAAGKEGSTIAFTDGHDGMSGGFLVVYKSGDGKNEQAIDLAL